MPPDDPSYSPPQQPPVVRRRPNFGWLMFLALVLAGGLAVGFVPAIKGQLNSLVAQPVSHRMNASVTVWANRQTGNYYCAGSHEYGQGQGSYMKQGEALTAGYQPELGQYCDAIESKDHTGR